MKVVHKRVAHLKNGLGAERLLNLLILDLSSPVVHAWLDPQRNKLNLYICSSGNEDSATLPIFSFKTSIISHPLERRETREKNWQFERKTRRRMWCASRNHDLSDMDIANEGEDATVMGGLPMKNIFLHFFHQQEGILRSSTKSWCVMVCPEIRDLTKQAWGHFTINHEDVMGCNPCT